MKKHDNPVLLPAPRRVAHVEPEPETQVAAISKSKTEDAEDSEIIRASARPTSTTINSLDPWANWEDDTAIFNSKVAATVNGAPILNGEVLDRYSGMLISMREDLQKKRQPPAVYDQQREMLIMRDLPGHIQRRLLVERMKSSMKPDQIKQINAHFDQAFEKEIDKLKREMKVSTRTELELELNKKGTTLQNVKDTFVNEQLAGGYFHSKLEKPKYIDRVDIVEYYQAHPSEFQVPAKVEWEQVQVSFGAGLTKEAARQKARKALTELQEGASFAEVAKKYSDGPSAKEGGKWDWMDSGTLADTNLEQKLFELPIGELADLYEGKSEFQIVRVTQRKESRKTPLGDVQEDIRKKLLTEQTKNAPKKFLEEIMSEAVIETKYDMMRAPPGQQASSQQASPE